jgi:uncharacterized protein YfaS (alpha-2-macroglobulin family)
LTTSATAGGILITPDSGDISPGQVITLSFPIPMVAPDRIDLGAQPWPFTATPKVDGTFLWKSETEGDFTVSSVVAGATHHLALAPGLRDASGHPFSVPSWGADFTAPAFSISTDTEFRKHLPAQPQIPLSATYDVLLAEVATHAWIQDRDSRAHFPIEVIQTTDGPPEAKEFQISPRDPLPSNHTYDLIIEGLQESKSHQPLPYPAVFPLGDTHDLKIDWLGAFNPALDTPTIRIKFNDTVSPDSLKPGMVRITPDVPNLEIAANDDEIDLTGDFDLAQRYSVTVSTALLGDRGYPLAAESRWAASFPPRQPCISFPGPRIYLRGGAALHFAFVQSHTPAVTWKLAAIPLEKLSAVGKRLDEFNQAATDPLTGLTIPDPKTGEDKEKQTELLVSAFNLHVLLTGSCPAVDSPIADETRTVTAPLPNGAPLAGPYLIEASSTLPDGRIAGGRALVFFSDYILTQKRSATEVFLRIARMSDALPVAGITVRAVTADNIELGRAVTDASGLAVFPFSPLFPENKPQTNLFIADTPGGPSLALADASAYGTNIPGGPNPVSSRALIVTDRNLYRPGEEVKMKGILRQDTPSGLAIPMAGVVDWQILQGDQDKVIGEGTATLSEDGAFEASWHIPEKAALGQCTLKCSLDGNAYTGSSTFDIEEYRVPLFTAVVDAPAVETGTTAHVRVSSVFFHGGANSGARIHWKAEWTATAQSGTDTLRYNAFPAVGPALDPFNELSKTIEGDTRLDATGQAVLACDSPFKDNPAIGVSQLLWHADITSIDGQTLAGGASETFSSSPILLGVAAEEKLTDPRGITVTLEAVDPSGDPVPNPAKVTADLYQVTTKTVKEQVAPLVFRYHNDDEFAKVDSRDATAPGSFLFSATATGDYVVAVRARDFQSPVVSVRTTVTGDQPAEMPVENDTGFDLSTRKEPWQAGDNAAFTLRAPFAGVAWVCVETDHILDTKLVRLSGNAARFEIPVKPEYAPNAVVSVYLTRPGGPSELPVERFAAVPLNVERPDRELVLTPHLDRPEARPGQTIHGEFRATSGGQPVPAADLAVFAVDDAVLQLGGWTLPDVLFAFYPLRSYGITNYQSLTSFLEQGNALGNFQKGFIIGDGGEEATPNVTNIRKEFRTLAYWNASLKTDADGKVSFDFQAPDNLTTYRIVAIGQTRASQFGADASSTVKISKPLLIDPALPRFLRDGDEVELRAVVRQSFADSTPVTARCITGAGCTLASDPTLTGTASRNAPLVLLFRAKITDPDLTPLKIRFEASAPSALSPSDAVEITIPVIPPTITRHESVAGPSSGSSFAPAAVMPKDWTQGRGSYSLTLSTSSWLPAIAGIPTILDYPHGCFEQITSKLLCYSLLANLMDYLPGTEARLGAYNVIFQQGIEQIGSSLLPDNRLPYWPGETFGNDFVTCQACWALNEAAQSGFQIPEGLVDKLAAGVKSIATGYGDSTTRAFALFVLASLKPGDDLSATAEDVYLHRVNMGYDGRALLALALHQLNIMPEAKLQLLAEIDTVISPSAFNPATFSSMDRTEGITALALETIAPPNFTPAKKEVIRQTLLKILDSASALSTQENLWLLLAFKGALDAQPPPPLATVQPPPDLLSKNRASAAWASQKLGAPVELSGLTQALTYLMQAEYTLPQLDVPRVDRGFRVERIVHDLTDPKRAGTPANPYRIGDQILLSYRVLTQKQQYYVSLEDSLPAPFEPVNPDLAQIGKFFELPPPDPADRLLELSHSEMRDRSVLLYFDDVPPGPGVYSILARVTAAGTFRWPQTQVTPMYDSRFSGLSASSVCIVSSE